MTDTGAVGVDAAMEVLAYLITAARTQVDEAAEYAPMRMLTAAQRLAEAMRDSAPPTIQPILDRLEGLSPTAVPRDDRDAYVTDLDGLCTELAECLLALHPGRPAGP